MSMIAPRGNVPSQSGGLTIRPPSTANASCAAAGQVGDERPSNVALAHANETGPLLAITAGRSVNGNGSQKADGRSDSFGGQRTVVSEMQVHLQAARAAKAASEAKHAEKVRKVYDALTYIAEKMADAEFAMRNARGQESFESARDAAAAPRAELRAHVTVFTKLVRSSTDCLHELPDGEHPFAELSTNLSKVRISLGEVLGELRLMHSKHLEKDMETVRGMIKKHPVITRKARALSKRVHWLHDADAVMQELEGEIGRLMKSMNGFFKGPSLNSQPNLAESVTSYCDRVLNLHGLLMEEAGTYLDEYAKFLAAKEELLDSISVQIRQYVVDRARIARLRSPFE
ncbi:Uncharacterised protein [Candidatus Burarchaeum australiense]|nr:Uncharacterised protein [Candidatus Burarchaeum australiense]